MQLLIGYKLIFNFFLVGSIFNKKERYSRFRINY